MSSTFQEEGLTLSQSDASASLLQKQNFDLKMQVYQLEEAIRKAPSSHSGDSSDTALKLTLEEKELELNQRNVLLAKAKQAIDLLKKELEKLKRENDPELKAELEARVVKLKKSNEDIEMSCRDQLNAMEKDLISSKEKSFKLEEEKTKIETSLEKSQDTIQQLQNQFIEIKDEKSKLDEEWLLLQQKCDRLEEECTQSRAHVELFRLETQEAIEEAEKLRISLNEANNTTHVADQLKYQRDDLELKHQEAVDAKVLYYEKIIHEHKLETDKAHEEGKMALSEEKDLHEQHLQQMTQRFEANEHRLRDEINKVKEEGRLERQREREEAAIRMDEGKEEMKRLNQKIDTITSKSEHHTKEAESARIELESCKVEISFRTDEAERSKSECHALQSQVTQLKHSHEQLAELKEGLRRCESEKETSIARLTEEKDDLVRKAEHIQQQMETLRHTFHINESRMKMAEAELSAIKAAHSTVETISRDNEKLKVEVHTLTNQLLAATHEASNYKRDHEHSINELADKERKIELHEKEILHLERDNANLKLVKDELSLLMKEDREKHGGMEGLLAELHKSSDNSINEYKAIATEYKIKLTNLEHEHHDTEKARLLLETRYDTMRHEYITNLQNNIETLENWDNEISELVDGVEDTSHIHTSNNRERESSLLSDSSQSITRALSQKGFLQKGKQHNITDDDLGDHLLPAIVTLTERIRIKMHRVSRLRLHLKKQTDINITNVTSKFDNSKQKSELLYLRITDSVANIARLKAVMDRDRKSFEHEQNENKLFRDQTLKQHAIALAESENRVLQSTMSMKDVEERRVKEVSEYMNQINQLNTEIASRDRVADSKDIDIQNKVKEIASLKNEIEAYGQAEQIVQDMSDKLQDLIAKKEELVIELENRDIQINNLNTSLNEYDNFNTEYENLLKEKDVLDVLCNTRGMELENLQKSLSAAESNIQLLKSRQITPELAQMIQDTQSIMRTTKTDNEQVLGDIATFEAMHQTLQNQAQASSSSSNSNSSVNHVQMSNPSESEEFQQWQKLKEQRSQSQNQIQNQSKMSPLPTRVSNNSNNNSSTPLGSMLNSNRGSSGSSSSSNNKSNSDARRSVFGASMSRSSPSVHSHSRSPINMNMNISATSSHSPKLQTSFLRSPQNFTSGTPQRVAFSPAAIVSDSVPSSRSGNVNDNGNDNGSRNNSTTSQRELTPNTQTRQSVNRLHKLGSDIEALARKLDGFDANDRNRWK